MTSRRSVIFWSQLGRGDILPLGVASLRKLTLHRRPPPQEALPAYRDDPPASIGEDGLMELTPSDLGPDPSLSAHLP